MTCPRFNNLRDIPTKVGASSRLSVDESYALCESLAKSHYENFSIASFLLPRDKRRHFYAVYAFCRFVDDLGDEFDGDRLSALDYWQDETEACFSGEPSHPYMIALQDTVRSFDIPREPLMRLIEANRMDQIVTCYPTYEDLEYYCQHSANPVGHLVLYVCGYRDEERQLLSDYTCTALQLANFWQDVARDYARGRIYIPMADMERFGYSEEELSRHEVTIAFKRLMEFQVDRARSLFEMGLPLVSSVDDNLRLDVALFSKGGMSVLDSIERQDYDIFGRRPTVGKAKKMYLLFSTLLNLKLFDKV